MGQFHEKRFPGESDAYREARDALLAAEADLRKRVEEVAALRRTLPMGGKVAEDYVFEEGARDLSDAETVTQTKLSELFASGRDSLVIYSFMYAPDAEIPCPMCTAFLDSLNGGAPHIGDRTNLAIVAKAPIQKVRAWARKRGWNNLRLLSSQRNSFNTDYFAEIEGNQWPMLNVFTRQADGIHHFYNAELFFASAEDGQHPRHVDMLWPLWNVLDVTPEGRGTGWFPKPAYD